MKKKLGLIVVAGIWAALALIAWLKPAKDISVTERRELAQLPELSFETIGNGSFMADFEDYTLDQFPLRENFRRLKAVTHYYVLGQQDNNGIYLADDHIAELAYPLDTDSVSHALTRFQQIYDLYLQDNPNIYATVVPDKGYYLAQKNGHPAMDYEDLFAMVQEGMPWAKYVDITHTLSLPDYYRTDTHWRQEAILDTAGALADAMGVTLGEYTVERVDAPFYGVYYGQAALPVEPDTMALMTSQTLRQCRVYNYTTDSWGEVYDLEMLQSDDPYQVYLSGAQSLLRIENPNGAARRELVIFRDSYGSSLAPLLIEDYSAVTLVDIRYILPQVLGSYVDFDGCDVLFLHSSLVLNKKLI